MKTPTGCKPATKAQLDALSELVSHKLSTRMAPVFLRHVVHDELCYEQAEHEIADLTALPNRYR